MDPAAHARLGITVTKRVGNAVVRNRIKRHVREAFRNAAWPDGVALVFIATGAAANADGRALCEAVDTIRARLAKARLSHTLRNAEPTLSEKSNSSGTSGQAP